MREAGNVINLPLRAPAVLARAVASLDLLSGGRVELGLGAGVFWEAIGAMGGRRLTPAQAVEALSEAIDIIRGIWDVDNTSRLRVEGSYFFQIRSVGGAVADVDPDATAYANRSANFQVVAFGLSRTRLDRIWDEMQDHVAGLYLSFETDLRPERLHDAFPPRTLERLRALKARYDPDNVFWQNVPITAEAKEGATERHLAPTSCVSQHAAAGAVLLEPAGMRYAAAGQC